MTTESAHQLMKRARAHLIGKLSSLAQLQMLGLLCCYRLTEEYVEFESTIGADADASQMLLGACQQSLYSVCGLEPDDGARLLMRPNCEASKAWLNIHERNIKKSTNEDDAEIAFAAFSAIVRLHEAIDHQSGEAVVRIFGIATDAIYLYSNPSAGKARKSNADDLFSDELREMDGDVSEILRSNSLFEASLSRALRAQKRGGFGRRLGPVEPRFSQRLLI